MHCMTNLHKHAPKWQSSSWALIVWQCGLHRNFSVPQNLAFTNVLQSQSDYWPSKWGPSWVTWTTFYQFSTNYRPSPPPSDSKGWKKFGLVQNRSMVMEFTKALASDSVLEVHEQFGSLLCWHCCRWTLSLQVQLGTYECPFIHGIQVSCYSACLSFSLRSQMLLRNHG